MAGFGLNKIGIVTALASEAACLTHENLSPALPCPISDRLLLVLSGMGESRVNHALESLLAMKVDGLISFGTAGALCSSMKSGDIVIPEKIVGAHGNTMNTSPSWRDWILSHLNEFPRTVHGGILMTTSAVISDSNSKKNLYENSGAVAVDMESALIMTAASAHNIPALSLRIIVDESNTTIPASILENTDAFGDASIPGIFASILRQPVLIRDLIRLGKAFRDAKSSMRWLGSRAERILLTE